eukprot:12404757-Karenia_brevis.AAC.1
MMMITIVCMRKHHHQLQHLEIVIDRKNIMARWVGLTMIMARMMLTQILMVIDDDDDDDDAAADDDDDDD